MGKRTQTDEAEWALRADEYLDARGRVRRRREPVPVCECCGARRAKVLMEIGAFPQDWVIKSCDRCSQYVCDGCCDTDADGVVVCVDCLQTEALRKGGTGL